MQRSDLVYAIEVIGARGEGQDRARVFERDGGLVIALADGAGGTAHGADAAQAIVDAAGRLELAAFDGCALLSALDRDGVRAIRGQSTAVLVAVRGDQIEGASVGDSGAWRLGGSDAVELTSDQVRKPLVGAGCVPVRIPATRLDRGTLLVASDGLWRYAKPGDITRLACGDDLSVAARALVDLVRLPGGKLQDDVAVVLCRRW